MADDEEAADEVSPLQSRTQRLGSVVHDPEVESAISSHISKEEQALGESAIGERLPYNDYTTIDWLHDLVCLCRAPAKGGMLIQNRSRTRSAIARSTARKGFGPRFSPPLTPARDGLRRR